MTRQTPADPLSAGGKDRSLSKLQKMISVVLYAILIVILAASVILIIPVYNKAKNKENEVARLEEQKRELAKQYSMMLAEVYELEHKAFAIEKIAREKYRLCRENEQILTYDE